MNARSISPNSTIAFCSPGCETPTSSTQATHLRPPSVRKCGETVLDGAMLWTAVQRMIHSLTERGGVMKRAFALAVCFGVMAGATPSVTHAQATRTWVSGIGDDVNPCSRTAPCKTFAGAISKTAAGGEISVLDNGSFGAVTITKAITINGTGSLAGILSAGTSGIIVNAGVNDRVIIRSVAIDGGGTGTNGIRFIAGKDLTVEDVTIEGFTTRGIDMSLATNGKLFVRNTKISEGATGVFLTTTSGQAQAMIENVHLTGLTNGLEAGLNGRATITDSVI